jgi:Tol biopolymer transport system component
MAGRTLTWGGVAALVALLALVLIPGAVMAKKPVKPPPDPEPDPDPAIVYYKSFKFDIDKLMVMNADGTNQTVAFDGEGDALGYCPSWSPDGKKLVFWSNVDGKGIYTYDLGTETLTKVCAVTTQFGITCAPVWSPLPVPDGAIGDGETYYIAFTDQETDQINDVFLVEPAANSTAVNLTNTEDVFEIGPTWSPSAGKLVIKWAHDDYRIGDKFVVYDLVEDTYTVVQHQGVFLGAGVAGYRFSNQDEDKLVCHAFRDIWTFELDNLPNPTRLTNTSKIQEGRACWSPDDSKIVFLAADDKGGRLRNHRFEVMSSTDGSGRTRIASEGSHPSWRRNE